MNNFYLELAEDINYENIVVHRKFCNDELCAYEIKPIDGYQLYDDTAENWELDPETMEEHKIIIYHSIVILPKEFNFDNFSYKSEKI